jgi:hypothetical protein
MRRNNFKPKSRKKLYPNKPIFKMLLTRLKKMEENPSSIRMKKSFLIVMKMKLRSIRNSTLNIKKA